MYDYNRISVAQPKVQDITPTEPEWKKGLAGFADEMQALGGGAAALAGQATGLEGVRDWGLDVYERNMEESTAGWQAPNVAKIEDIKPFETGGMDRLGDWAAYHGTKGLANVASLALSGGIGGAIAKGATKRAVKEIAKSQVGKNLAGRTVTAGIKKDAVDEVRRNVTRGVAAGGFVGAFGMEGGGAFGQQVGGGVAPEDALFPSLGVGAVNAALELVAPYQIAKKLGLVGKAREGIAAVIPKDRALAKRAIELAGKVVKGGASSAATEGLTEGIQELVQLAGERWAKDEELLADLSPEDRSQIMNAAAAGALVGGGVGGATGPFVQEPTRAPEVQPIETTADIDEATKTAAAQAGQEAGTPEGSPAGEQATSPRDITGALPLEGEFVPGQQATQEEAARQGFTIDQTPEGAWFVRHKDSELTSPEFGSLEEAQQALAGEYLPKARAMGQDPAGLLEGPIIEGQASPETRLGMQKRLEAPDAQAIREDESGLPQLGQVQEGMYAGGRRDGEQTPQEGRPAPSQVPPKEDVNYTKWKAQQNLEGEVTPEQDAGLRQQYEGMVAARPTKDSRPAIETITKADGTAYKTRAQAQAAIARMNKQKDPRITKRGGALRDVVTRETEEGWVIDRLESTTSGKADKVVSRTVQEVETALTNELGQGWITRAKKAGMLNILDEAGPNGRQADYNQETGEITIYAKSLGEGPIAAVALHEGSHATMDELLGGRLGEAAREVFTRGAQEAKAGQETNAATAARKAEQVHYRWKAMQLQRQNPEGTFLKDYDALAETGKSGAAKSLVNDAWVKLDQEVRASLDERANEILNEEAVAYFVEGSAGKADGLLRQIVGRIKAEWLASAPGQTFAKMRLSPKIDDGTAVALARKATKYAVDLREEMDRRGAPSAEGSKIGAELDEIAKKANAPASSLERMSGVLESLGSFDKNWVSTLGTAVEGAKQNKMQPSQWLGWLKKQPGVRAEEIEDTGLEDWLDAQPVGVSKEAVKDFLDRGGVKVEEKVLGAEETRGTAWFIAEVDGPTLGSSYTSIEEAQAELEDLFPNRSNLEVRQGVGDRSQRQNAPTEFSAYTLPGGENYRELLITVPTDQSEPGYKSSHWSEPNVLVHIRFNERIDANGDRVLFVEEVQSDWHQEGRKEGYQIDTTPRRDQEKVAVEKEGYWEVNTVNGDFITNVAMYEGFNTPEAAVAEANRRLAENPEVQTASSRGAPNAPFKSSWPMLGMKRAIKWAAENGFDKVAWQKDPQGLKHVGGWTDLEQRGDQWFANGDQNVTSIVNRYVRDFPRSLAKFGKKYGAKVGQTIVSTNPEYTAEELREVSQLDPNLLVEKGEGAEAWSFPITPKLKAQAEQGMTLYSMRDFADSWVSSPLSEHYDEVTSPRLLNKLKHYYVEKFNDLWKMSKEAATKFNLATSKKASAQKDFEKEFIYPWRDLMVKLSEDMSKDGKKYSVEDLNDAWASWSVVNDNLNVLLARRNSNESLDQLNKEIFAFEKTLDAGDPIRVRLKELRLEWEKGRKNLLAGMNWDGTTPQTNDKNPNARTTRNLTTSEVQHKMMEKLEELFDAPVEGTKVWQASEKLQELRMEWEMMKYQGSGLATPDTASQVPEVRAELEKIIRLHGDRAPKNAYELHDAVKGNASFLAAVPKAKEIAKRGRDALVKGELITREEADAMGDMYKHWMPLQREDYDYDESVKKLFGRGQGSGKPQTRAGTSKINPPVHTMQNLMASFDASLTAMEGNLARKYLADEIQANPERWENWFEVTQDKDAQRSMGKYGFIQTRKAGGEPVDIPFYRNGERWLIKPNTVNNRAVMLSNAIQNLDSQELGPVFKMMNKVNSWIRWTNISASPAFLLMNAPRDYFTAMLNLKGTELADFTKDVRKEVGPSLKALNNHFRKGIDDPEIREWEEAGGRISFVESLRPNDETWGSLEAQIKHRQGDFNFGPGMEANFGPGVGVAVSKGRDFLERLETINIMAENVMRYSTWKVAKQKFLDQGMTEQQAKDKAALLSKDVTTNFDRKGLRAQTLGTYWLFYNATVQGNAQVIRNLFEGANKQKLWGALAGVAAFAFINDQLGAELSDDEDKDGRSDWDSTPEWKKEKFGRIAGSNVLWPGEESTFATVPLPWVFNTVWRFGEMVSESLRGVKDPTEIPADMVGLMLNTFNPIGGSDTTPMQMAAPTAADPIVQILENTSAFGRPLGPTQYPGQELTPDSELAWLSTPPRYKWLAQQINDITGGTPAEKGLVDWRPSTYKVLADTLMGGGGRFLEQLVGSGFTAATGKAPEIKDVPFIKPFLFAPGDPIEAEKYHERMAKVEQAKHAEKTFMKGSQRDLMELQRVRADYAGELRMVGMANDVERQLKDLRKQLRMAQVRGQDSRVEFLKGKMEKAQERFNKTWASRVGN